jgi:hypothetical protein
VVWIADHWDTLVLVLVELFILTVALFILNRLYAISNSLYSIGYGIEAIRAASVENVRETNSVRHEVGRVASASTSVENELRAIDRELGDIYEVLIYGRGARDLRLRAERKVQFDELQSKAEAGDLQAQGLHADNCARREDYVQAHIWYNIATARSSEPKVAARFTEKRDEIAMKLTPEQLAEAGSKARDWLDTHPASQTRAE